MDKSIFQIVDKLSLDELQTLSLYISNKINSWNTQVNIEEICYDFELKEKLLSMGIKNMDQLKKNGVIGLPESMWEKAGWMIKTFDFDKLEYKQYNKKVNYSNRNLTN